MHPRRTLPLVAAAAVGALLTAALPLAQASTPTDAATAQAAARETGSPVEVVSARTATSATYANPDGSWSRTIRAAADTWIDSGSNKASQATSPELRIGSTNSGFTKARSYLTFDTAALAGIPSTTISSAAVTVSDFVTGSCAGSAIRMSRVTAAWSVTGLTWAKQPATTATGSSTTKEAHGAAKCPAEGPMTFDATAILAAWAGGSANYGVQLKADSASSSAGFRKLRSLENGDLAKAATLSVTYDNAPVVPTDLAVAPGNEKYITSTTPTLSARVTDPDGGQARAHFQIYTQSTASLIWEDTSDWVTSGDVATLDVPEGVLTGEPVYVAAFADDGKLESATAQVKAYRVDTVAPVVTITATGYTNGGWDPTPPTSNTFTLDGPSDTATFHLVIDGWYDVTAYPAASGSGDFSFAFAPASGVHTVQATATDKAGNVGPTATFTFGAGVPVPAS
ncbi:MAG: DNRLRE domain-containing protein [Nocardioidaceae bacterium]|nr:DNRLRE domain-containing protein [Nocardioidaceae bacterium]